MTLTEREYLGVVASLLGSLGEDELDEFVSKTNPQELGPFILAARELKRRASRLEALLEYRYGREMSTQLYLAPDGARYIFRTDKHRELADPEGLKDELAKLSMDGRQRNLLEAAFKRETKTVPNHGYLNQLADRSKEAAEVIRSYRGWKHDTPHLEQLDTVTRPATYEVVADLRAKEAGHKCNHGCDSPHAVNCNCQGRCSFHRK